MPIEVTKDILGAIALSCLAIRCAVDWKVAGLFNQCMVVGCVIMAVYFLVAAVSELATR